MLISYLTAGTVTLFIMLYLIRDGTSQEEVLRKYCGIQNIMVRKVIYEDYSAKTFNRPAWTDMLNSFKKDKGKLIDLLLFTKWDRFSHSAGDAYQMINILRKVGIDPQAVEQPLDLSSIYLALDFTRTNHDLSLRLAEVEELSNKALAQEAEKLELITHQAEKLEVTVLERTAEVRRQADQLLEMDKVKSRFFVNLTHEFRTPLTLILGPVQQLLAEAESPKALAQGQTIRQNAESLLRLINQLLDLSKLEAGKMELQNSATDVFA